MPASMSSHDESHAKPLASAKSHASMSLMRLATRSLWHFWRTNLALLAGIAIATAVLIGALIVGDSVRESLRRITRERLGTIDEILLGQQFFHEDLARRMADSMPSTYQEAIPTILVNQATLESTGPASQRAKSVTVLGISSDFWKLDISGLSVRALGPDQIVINEALASELNAVEGDRLILRVGDRSGIAADSPLARKEDLVKSIVDLEIVQIIPTQGLGRFSLQASQQIPANAFVDLETLQNGIDQEDRINAVFFASENPERVVSGGTFADLQKSLQPTLDDLGLSLESVKLEYQQDGAAQPVLEYQTITNDRMIFSETQANPLRDSLSDSYQTLSTYLATKMQRVDAAGNATGDIVAYSTITAVDSVPQLGPLLDDDKQPIALGDQEIALNSWTAEAMGAKLGDRIRVTYFEPESSHRDPTEVSAEFTLKAIVPITVPDRPFSRRRDAVFTSPPTLANDPHLTPEVEGITDAESISRWDAPFPMDRSLITGRDDDYWEYYRTTPKAFISSAAGQRLWKSRFGYVTSFRVANENGEPAIDAEQLQDQLAQHAELFDMTWLRVKQDGIQAAKGTTPFDVLFLGFSQFIIASALILISLLLRLSLEQRARQIGVLQAMGWSEKRTRRALLTEMALLVVLGAGLGALLGIVYGKFMVTGLQTWWVDAIVTPFMQLTLNPASIVLGAALGAVAALATLAWTLRGFRSLTPSQLIGGVTSQPVVLATGKPSWLRWLPGPLIALAVLLGLVAPTQPVAVQGGMFFGSGFCVLAALLTWFATTLRQRGEMESRGHLSMPSLAFRNLTRQPTQSTLTIGLVAAACFLIIAISAFRLAPSTEGTGGFAYVGKSDQPIFDAAITETATRPSTSTTEVADAAENATTENDAASNAPISSVLGLRLQDGDDASCRNLFQSRRPQLIGITPAFIERMKHGAAMQWAGSEAVEPADIACPWRLLQAGSESEAIPVVIDKATAMYGMQIYSGVGTEFERDYGDAGKLRFRIVGFLSGSIFQGSLLIPEDRLIDSFPRVSGYRYFVTESGVDAASLEGRFSDQGLDLVSTETLLKELLAVQNTYLSTFQSLGGLGLLLGTLGLAAVQVRNVVQRRREFSLMRATGFRNARLSEMILREHSWLLLGGLAVGAIAALVVVLPHFLFGGASIPVISLATTLGMVLIVGLVTGWMAQRSLQSKSLIDALRDD